MALYELSPRHASAMLRPPALTARMSPGLSSSLLQTTWRCIAVLLEIVEIAGVLREDLSPKFLRETAREDVLGRVEVPVGVVGGEEEELLRPYHLEHLVQVLGVLGVLHGLRREANVLPYVLARHTPHPRHLAPEAPIVVVETPHRAGHP